ncbi:hypothetical protein [Erythrobacter sp.]|jgi:hypothetical protein|uniref:hypothetical protein n=1 Tax=Erythrobacter sp. TaxID=1042 RepID=UPI002ECEEE0A|nr:hypothetical protein [Erythrobacter sp.]
MDVPPFLLQFAGSLLAIFALYVLARTLRLGGRPTLADEDAVRVAAGEVEDGFEARRVAISREGKAALVADAKGRIMVIKLHGNRFAGRILTRRAQVSEEVDALIVDNGDARFGPVRLAIERPGSWADAINRL